MDILNAFKNWVDTGHFEEPGDYNNASHNNNAQASPSAVAPQPTQESRTNIFNALKNWVDTGHFEEPVEHNNPPQNNTAQASSSAAAHQPNPEEGFFGSLLASAKKSIHDQSDQLTTTVSDLGKKLTDQSQDAISSAFSSAKSSILSRISPSASIPEQTSPETTAQVSETIQKSEALKSTNIEKKEDTIETEAQPEIKTDGILSSISNTLNTKASGVLNQGKEKIHHSVEKLKQQPHNISPMLESFYHHGISVVKSKLDKTPDTPITETHTNTQIKTDDQKLKDSPSLDTVVSMHTDTTIDEDNFKQPEFTKADTALHTSTSAKKVVNLETYATTPDIDYQNAFPPRTKKADLKKAKIVEPQQETASTIAFQEQDVSIEKDTPVQAEIQVKTKHQEPVKPLSNHIPVSKDIKEASPPKDKIQTKTTHQDHKDEAVSTNNLSSTTQRSVESTEDPIAKAPKKSPFRILIPVALLLLSLFAIWRLGLINLDLTNRNKQAVAQQPVTTEAPQDSLTTIAASTENTQESAVIEPSQTVAANTINTDANTAQIEPQAASEISAEQASAAVEETSQPIQTAVVNTPEIDAAPVSAPEVDTTSIPAPQAQVIQLSNLAPPLVKIANFIKSDGSLPAAFTLEGMKFLKPSTDLTRGSAQIISDLATVMNAYPSVQIRLESHTDSRGSLEDNLTMTQTIADTAKAQLVNQGVDPARIEAAGMGESSPIDSNHADAWKSINRRIIAVITAR